MFGKSQLGARVGAALIASAVCLIALVALAAPGRALAAGGRVPAGMPSDVPPAATAPDPTLPEPSHAVWPFPSSFSPTSGTGHLAGGAALWSDFIYDDYGASGLEGFTSSPFALSSALSPRQGDYAFPHGAADNNGADIFRAGVGLTPTDSVWRVDWVTLADPSVPIAEWTFDTDANASTGVSAWPAGAGVSSPGIERALVVSGRGAWLIDPRTGARTDITAHGGSLTVDRASKSFIVHVPRSLLPVNGVWRIRLGAGLADASGQNFAPADVAGGISQTAERVYNVTFRTVAQEPPVFTDGQTDGLIAAAQAALGGTPLLSELGLDGLARDITGNFWMEDDQADTLATRDVSRFSLLLDWSQLAAHTTTPIPRPSGYSVRWYVSRFAHMGQGQVIDDGPEGNFAPTLLDPVQPYAVYVPTTLSSSRPAPLTFILHSLEVNDNQYGALDPQLLQQLCEDRNSICATTEGLGPSGWYFNGAETDFWQVWRHLAEAYRLDPNRTVISGYSMGGWASYKLALEHPDDFAGAMVLDGPVICGVEVLPGVDAGVSQDPGCARDGQSAPLLANAKWIPYVIDQTFGDELVPTTGVLSEAHTFDTLGERYDLIVHTGGDHLIYATQDRFDDAVRALGNPFRVQNPGSFHFSWYPSLNSAADGTGVTGDYFLSGLSARTSTPGSLASIAVDDQARPGREITVERGGTALASQPLPGTRTQLTWNLGSRPAPQARLSLDLTNVAGLGVDTTAARMHRGTITVTSDGPARLTLLRLPAHTVLRLRDSRSVRRTGDHGRALRVLLPAGTSVLSLSRR